MPIRLPPVTTLQRAKAAPAGDAGELAGAESRAHANISFSWVKSSTAAMETQPARSVHLRSIAVVPLFQQERSTPNERRVARTRVAKSGGYQR